LGNRIAKAVNEHEKEYVVKIKNQITDEFINKMSKPVHILDTVTRPCKVWKIDNHTFGIILTQGLNRQIRRMTEACGEQVTFLKRIRVMNIKLGNLGIGKYRECTQKEIDELKQKVYK
jgi:23S rRNA pseudouridine2604 synthase